MSKVRRFLQQFSLYENYTYATFNPESLEVDGITFRGRYPFGSSSNKIEFIIMRDNGYLYLLPQGNIFIAADKPFDNCDYSDRVSFSFNPYIRLDLGPRYDETNSGSGEDLITKYGLPKDVTLAYQRNSNSVMVANFANLYKIDSPTNKHYRIAVSKLERLFENSNNLDEEVRNYIDDNLVIPLIKYYKMIYAKIMNPKLLGDIIKQVKAFNEMELIESMELKEDLNKVIYGQGWTIRTISANWYGEHDLLKINANGTYDFRKYYSKGANYPWARFPSEEKAEAFFDAMKLEPDLYEVTKCKKPKYMILQDSKYAVYKTLPEKPYGYSDDQIGYIDGVGNVGEIPSIPKSVLGSNEKLAKYIFKQLENSILSKVRSEIKSPERIPPAKGRYEIEFLGYGDCSSDVIKLGNGYGLHIQNKYNVLYRDTSAVISEIDASFHDNSMLNNYLTSCYKKYWKNNIGEKIIIFSTTISNTITVNNLFWELEEKNLIPEALKDFDGAKLTQQGAEKINLFVDTCKKNSSVLIDLFVKEASKAYKEGSKDYFPAVKEYIENFTEVVVIENYARDTLYDLYDDKWDED